MMRAVVQQRWSVLFGLIVGVVVSFASFGTESLLKFYDEINPVVRMRGEIVQRDADAVFVRIWGEKRRACRYASLQTFGVDERGEMHFVMNQYIGSGTKGTLPVGDVDLGIWRLWPTAGAVAVRAYAGHDCGGRLVITQIAEVAL